MRNCRAISIGEIWAMKINLVRLVSWRSVVMRIVTQFFEQVSVDVLNMFSHWFRLVALEICTQMSCVTLPQVRLNTNKLGSIYLWTNFVDVEFAFFILIFSLSLTTMIFRSEIKIRLKMKAEIFFCIHLKTISPNTRLGKDYRSFNWSESFWYRKRWLRLKNWTQR